MKNLIINRRNNVFLFLILSGLIFTGCVSAKKYDELEGRERRLMGKLSTANEELESLKADREARKIKCDDLEKAHTDLKSAAEELKNSIEREKTAHALLQDEYNRMKEHYKKQLSGKNSDLESAQEEMLKTKRDLELRETEIKEKEAKYSQLQNALQAKDEEVALIRKKLSDALVGFADKGLSVEVRDGKVYVSMEEKLLFASGSWSISKDGLAAIKEVAKILENNTDINVMIEGHTDNVPLKGRNEVKDNWDLSVMRATSIVKALLTGSSIDATRIIASGKGEFMPLVKNDSEQNRAKNRRSEIILTPNMDAVMKLLND